MNKTSLKKIKRKKSPKKSIGGMQDTTINVPLEVLLNLNNHTFILTIRPLTGLFSHSQV